MWNSAISFLRTCWNLLFGVYTITPLHLINCISSALLFILHICASVNLCGIRWHYLCSLCIRNVKQMFNVRIYINIYTHICTLVIQLDISFGRLTAFHWFIFALLFSFCYLLLCSLCQHGNLGRNNNRPTEKKNWNQTVVQTAVHQNTQTEGRVVTKINRRNIGQPRERNPDTNFTYD